MTNPASPAPSSSAATRAVRRAMTAVRGAFFDGKGIFSAVRTAYEAAARNPRIERSVDSGPNGSNGEIELIRRRSRHAYRNDPTYRQSMRQVANNVVHYGIKPIIPYPDLGELWEDWVEEADSRGHLDFYGLQWFGVFTTALSGEIVYRFRERQGGDMESVPFQIQMMEGDHIPLTLTHQAENGNWIVSGVERDWIDRVAAYHIYPVHPKDWTGKAQSLVPQRVPADDVVLMYWQERPGDTRGVPWAAAALNTYESLRTYDIAELERKKGASNFGGFYRKPIDDDGTVPGAVGDAYDDVMLQPLEPNTFVELPPGYDVTLSQPPTTDTNYGPYRRENLSAAAVSVGLAYEHITLNFEKVNDRQYRAMMLEVGRLIESLQYHMVVQQLCKPVWRRFVRSAILSGKWSPPSGARARDYMRVEWVAPARGHIHPVQEITAIAESIRAGTFSRKRAAALLGDDVEKIDMENSRDRARAEKLGLRYSVYPGDDGSTVPESSTAAAVAAIEEEDVEGQIERLESAESA
mgnify:CR=1 FL=1